MIGRSQEGCVEVTQRVVGRAGKEQKKQEGTSKV